MNSLMIDLETLGVTSTAPIVSIGAVFFDLNTASIGETFYQAITLESAMVHGTVEVPTLRWWFSQSSKAKSVFSDSDAIDLPEALDAFTEFVTVHSDTADFEVWGNGASFDNAILANCYARLSKPLPWKFRNDRDVRTMVSLCKRLKGVDPIPLVSRKGIHHNSLDDASFQALYLISAFKLLRGEYDYRN
ncbi:3'-5' exonuclease [Serratia proteamaculans]|uniref:3'-5' exonuclease n=1 Tax=Serratia proteamaculans TaxID=28151 RepID=UPI00217A23DA|nr:3'-5' exonuclease [Serratia proteamaculans]CAI0889054.1 Uncharacterised protein [Serratia proteamaculans]CAI1057946.1 Uncharacterised protein [Serratia proteamaculans]